MVRWYHAIFTAYGFWLRNDPRGSWSDFVASWEIYKFGGPATKTTEKRSLAHDVHDAQFRRDAKTKLKYPPVKFDDRQRQCIAEGVAQACHESGITVHAFIVGHDHGHAVIGRHAKTVEQVVGQFKGRATQAMRRHGCHPLQRFAIGNNAPPSAWCEGIWSVFINDDAQLSAAINYVNHHPEKEGLPPQRWPFVIPV